jgi:hypothetical protein
MKLGFNKTSNLFLTISIVSILLTDCKKDKENIAPEERSFYMGFTTWPFDFTDSAKLYTYSKVNELGDLIAFHFDNGIPWNEALANNNYPKTILDDLAEKKSNIQLGHKLYVSVAPLRSPRTKLALYRSTNDNQPLPSPWDTISFENNNVISAYINYCCLLIDKLNPDYFNYGIESNSNEWTVKEFSKYKIFCSKVYAALKQKYPNLNLMLSVMVDANQKSFDNASELMPFTDYVALSIYPYVYIGSVAYGDANPDNFPADWLSKMKSIAPDKKFGITETGFIAEDLNLSDYGVSKHGKEDWQANYIAKLLTECENLKAEFVIYWEVRDYDLGWQYLQSIGLNNQALSAWKDIGLLNGNGEARPSFSNWKEWLNKKHD